MSRFVKLAIEDYYSENNWTTIIHKYWTLTDKVSDPRVQGWLFFETPLLTIACVLSYLTFVLVVGPLLMANRKPFQLRKLLIGYNAAQILLSSYMFYEHLMSGWWGSYSFSCEPVDYSNNQLASRMLHLCWVYYFSKLSEFADTIFFVLRKKKNQISGLHLYHHSITPFEAWLLVKFVAGGHGTFSNVVNNLIHVFLYTYYLVAALGPQYRKHLWFKKYLTQLQILQFIMVFFHSASAIICDCGYPKFIAFGLMVHSVIFFILFTNFYNNSYKRSQVAKNLQSLNNNVEKDDIAEAIHEFNHCCRKDDIKTIGDIFREKTL